MRMRMYMIIMIVFSPAVMTAMDASTARNDLVRQNLNAWAHEYPVELARRIRNMWEDSANDDAKLIEITYEDILKKTKRLADLDEAELEELEYQITKGTAEVNTSSQNAEFIIKYVEKNNIKKSKSLPTVSKTKSGSRLLRFFTK